MVENIRTGEKNNWNLNPNEFVNFASSLSNFLAQSSKIQKNIITETNSGFAEPQKIKTDYEIINKNNVLSEKQTENNELIKNNKNSMLFYPKDMNLSLNLNDSQLQLPIEILNSLNESIVKNTNTVCFIILIFITNYKTIIYYYKLIFDISHQ